MDLDRRMHKLFLIIIGIICILIFILDFTGLLDRIKWISDRIPALILLTLGLIILYIIPYVHRKEKTLTIRHLNLADCFPTVTRRSNHVRHMRILALSTGMIRPLFAASDLVVDECTILLRGFSDTEVDESNIALRNHIEEQVKGWKRLHREKRIRKLNIHLYCFQPTEYSIIIDDNTLISGLYTPIQHFFTSVHTEDPCLIDNATVAGSILIRKYIRRFEGFLSTLLETEDGRIVFKCEHHKQEG